MRTPWRLVLALTALSVAPLRAAEPTADFRPDPLSVQRHGRGYRYPQAGWIVLHIEGEPYERGEQHGRLLAPEIVSFVRCFATQQGPKGPEEAWRQTRTLVNALFVRKFEPEYLEEMKGIADGAAAAGAKYDGRPIDLTDIVALNCMPEIDTLDSALEAWPTGLEGRRFPQSQPRKMPAPPMGHCSAFAATGPATADGRIVFGHITMFGLYSSLHFNVWLDVQPAKGHRVLMQTFPGGIQSGMDYYMNSAGLLVTETTIRQTRYDIEGLALAGRIRKALQYADSIDAAVDILKVANNGLYTNEWLLADIKTNEIAMFELGTHKSRLYRSSKGEWYGGTEGFYWGCNNTKDLDVRLETIPSVNDRPANLVWRPSDRDKVWLSLYAQHKGKIDADFGRKAFTTAPLAAYHSLDAKYTTTALAKQLKTWALFGPPLGRPWEPREDERRRYPEIRPLVPNPWTILHAAPPAETHSESVAIDLSGGDGLRAADRSRDRGEEIHTTAAWHGTILPKTDADVWLAASFAEYEKIVALEKALLQRHRQNQSEAKRHPADPLKKSHVEGLSPEDRDRLALELMAHRNSYLTAVRAVGDVPLAKTHATPGDEWYRIASGKGVLVLNELRRVLGADRFDRLMDDFGSSHAGQAVRTADFVAHCEKAAGRPLAPFFEYWLTETGLPTYRFGRVIWIVDSKGERADTRSPRTYVSVVMGAIERQGTAVPAAVKVAVGGAPSDPPTVHAIELTGPVTKFELESGRNHVITLDKYHQTAKANGSPFSPFSFYAERDKTLIVYGTRDEEAANRSTAEALQERIRTMWSNETLPIKADKDVTDDDVKNHHLLLIGRPDCNRLVDRFRAALPVEFGWRSFVARDETFAHAGSAVITSVDNPANPRFSVVVLAGLSAEATTRTPAALFTRGAAGANAIVLPHGQRPKAITIVARELVQKPKP
jgi:hypothetical protein